MADQVIYYNFSNADKSLIGSVAFNLSATADQQVTTDEGLKISFTYKGQTFTQTSDPAALLLTNTSGEIRDQGLGLQFVTPSFTINANSFIDGNSVQDITYSPARVLSYNFSNLTKTLTGTVSFNAATADDQQVTSDEGLSITGTYNGKSFTQTADPSASLLTSQSGDILDKGLGLQLVTPDFTVNADNFVDASTTSTVNYKRVAPKVIVISLDGATNLYAQSYINAGIIPADKGLGLLKAKGVVATANETITPSLTAPAHIAIATGSSAVNNDINSNSFHLIASPFASNISGFGAPIGGYDYFGIDGNPSESTNPTAIPVWAGLRAAGKKVVTATFPGGDGVDVKVPGLANSPIIQSKDKRTVDYTVPFGAFGGVGAQGFTKAAADFSIDPTQATTGLQNLGVAFYGAVKVANLETIPATGAGSLTGGGGPYNIQVAAIDTTNDNVVNYDTVVFFDAARGIESATNLPSTGSAFVKASDKTSSPFLFDGNPNFVGTSFYASTLAPDLSSVKLARYGAYYIPRPAESPGVVANVDDVNTNVGFWRPQPDFRIPERISPGFTNFSDPELEAIYADQVKSFVDYQARVAVRSIQQNANADVVFTYIEQPDGSEHQFMLTDPRQATTFTDPNTIGAGQDAAKVARYQTYLQSAYQAASNAVQKVIDEVGVDANGVPNSNIIVVSDHGFDPFHTAVSINNLLRSSGDADLSNTNKVRAITSGPATNIYINLIGREPNGTVTPSEYVVIQQKLINLLKGAVDTNPNYTNNAASVSVFDKVYNRDVPANPTAKQIIAARGSFIGEDTGDVFALLNLGYNFDGIQGNGLVRKDDPASTAPILSVPNFYGAHGNDPTTPDLKAIFYAAGPDISPGYIGAVNNIDIAPTIDKLLGIAPAKTVEGKAIDLSSTRVIPASPQLPSTVAGISFIGQATYAAQSVTVKDLTRTDSLVGGLSGITYDARNNVFYSISDDRKSNTSEPGQPTRFYKLGIDLSSGTLDNSKVSFNGVTYLRKADGTQYLPQSTDTEDIALTSRGTVFVSSEGQVDGAGQIRVNPFINEYRLSDGQLVTTLPIPTKFLPDANTAAAQTRGTYDNLAFESTALTPDGRTLFTASENALVQDGQRTSFPGSDPKNPSGIGRSRILKFNLDTNQPTSEYLYLVDPTAVAPSKTPAGVDNFSTAGLVALTAIDNNGNFLALERSFSSVPANTPNTPETGNVIKLYQITIGSATDISGIQSLNALSAADFANIKPVQKRLILNFDDLKLQTGLDNVEGVTFGPTVNGKPTIVLVADDNFNKTASANAAANNFNQSQLTQILAFTVDLTDAVTPLFYTFASPDKSIVGSVRYDQGAAADQQVTTGEGLLVSVTYAGKTYTQLTDPAALVLTNQVGQIGDLGLGLQFVVPNLFTINGDNFVDANGVQTISYTSARAPFDDTITGTPKDDSLVSLGKNTLILGLDGNDIIDTSAGGGNNELRGGNGNDELIVGTKDAAFGEGGNDILDASAGKGGNILDGGAGDDTLFASKFDTLRGGAGNDTLFAGLGGNFLSGGSGQNKFIIPEIPTTPNVITDFRPDRDTISVAVSGVNNFSDISITQQGNNTVISAQGADLAVLLNTQANTLNANNLGGVAQTLGNKDTVRFAQFNASLNRSFEGELVANLSTPDNQQAKNVAETVQINRPDVLVINEFDYVADGSAARLFQDNYLSIAQNNASAINYPYFYVAPSNTGIASGFDLNNNGAIVTTPGAPGYGDDAFGFGNFPGQFAFVIYSKYPIVTENIRTFQNFLWKDLPGNLLTNDPTIDNPATPVNENLNGFYSPEEIAVFRLSSKNHVDVPININGKVVNVLVSHPTPPVFDGTEDRNGKRNSDEIRFFSDYINGADYIVDDKGKKGGLAAGSSFVLLGDQNSDPFDGDSRVGAIQQLLTNPNVNSDPSSVFPSSLGGVQQSDDGGININQKSNPAFDTADFGDSLTGAGNLRADYVLPSQDLTVANAGVFIPLRDDPLFRLVGERGSFNTFQTAANTPTSDHSLVFIDVAVNGEKPANPKVTGLDFLGQVTFPGASVDVLGTKLGGLSGITYDPAKNVYYAISDDRGTPTAEPGQAPRFYTLNIDLSSGLLPSNGVTFTGVTTLKRADGSLYPVLSTDTEGIALTKNGTVFITSEGEAAANGNRVNPFVNEYNLVTGQLVRSLVVPQKFLPTALNLFGLSADGSQLLRFNNPNSTSLTSTSPITGVVAGETLVGIDIRPLNGQLYGLGVNATADKGTLYLIDPRNGSAAIATGTAGQVSFVDANGTPLDLPATGYGIDFNPTVDRLRVVTSTGLNFRVNPLTGGVVDGDAVAAGNNPDGAINGLATGISATAYTNSVNGATVTTQYGLDPTTNTLFIQNPPNSGTQTAPLPITLDGTPLDFTEVAGFDIPATVSVTTANTPATGIGYAALTVGGTSGLYAIELSTGAATLVKSIPTGLAGLAVSSVVETTPTIGTRNNLAFESATITPNQKFLFTATENALVQDGSAATATSISNVRILKYNLATGNPEQEYLYVADAVEVAPNPSTNFSTSGLVDLLALSDNTFLALERSFTVGAPGTGNTIKIYEVTIDGATDINTISSLTNLPTAIAGNEIIAVQKRLLLNLDDLKLSTGLDNVEGITFGANLPDGRRSIVLVSDNNFGATAFTQVLAFALNQQPTVLPTVETTPTLVNDGAKPFSDRADANDPAIYVNPRDSNQSFVIASVKNGGLRVYDLDGNLAQSVNQNNILYNNVDLVYGFQLGATKIDLAVASDRNNDKLAIFKINPQPVNGIYVEDITSTLIGTIFQAAPFTEPYSTSTRSAYGLATYTSPVTGDNYVFVSRRQTGDIAQLKLEDLGNGSIGATTVRTFTVPALGNDELSPQVKGMVVDRETGFLYLAQENVGIYKYGAEPNSSSTGVLIDNVKALGGKNLANTVKGLTIYYTSNGTGYLLASSQGDNTFAVYSREGYNDYLGSFKVGINGEVDGVQGSDGVDITNVSLGSKFPFGLFVAQDGSNDPVIQSNENGKIVNIASNFKFVPYENVAATFDLNIDTQSYNPRNLTPKSLLNGVASGDTTQSSTVLFTRSNFIGDVRFEYSTVPDLTTLVGSKTAAVTDPLVPVKVQIDGLTPNTAYYYRITDAAGAAGFGQFKTSAELGTKAGLRFGAAGDWRGELAPYPAISNAANLALDFFIELGDTIYADFPTRAVNKPQAETLEEFRTKHSEVYSARFGTNTLADLRASTSVLLTYDDHEVTNDFAGGAPASTDPRFGTESGLINDTSLFDNGLKAFQEYNPIKDNFYGATGDVKTAGERSIYRYNTYGSDAASFILDGRSFRDTELVGVSNLADPAQVGGFIAASFDPTRTLLGRQQLDDLKRDLLQAQNDGINWKFITVPEPIQNLGVLAAGDRFEGYAAERTEILKFINDNKISNVVFIAADIHGTLVNNLTYQTAPGTPQIATSAFEVTTGSVAFDAPFGQTVATIAAQLGLLPPAQKAFYDSLPIANDTDSIINDKDDFIKNLTNTQLKSLGYDPLGLNDNLASATGLINANLLQGDYIAVHTYGFSEFNVDQSSQKLTVTTYGIEAYTEKQLLNKPKDIIARTPQIVSQFEVGVAASTSTTVTANALITGNTGDNGILALGQNTIFTGAGTDFVFASTNTVGNSRIYGGEGNDSLQASTGDRVFGQDGDDRLDATRGNGNNRLYGGDGNDSLFARANDQLFGGNGDDLLYAGTGGNTLTGGNGSDVFLLVESILPNSINTITDFEIGIDTLRISGIVGETNLTITQQGADTLIGAFGRNLAVLSGIQATDISDANFTFG